MTEKGLVRMLAIILWVGLWVPPVGAGDAIKIGIMDQQVIMEKSKAGKSALEDIRLYSAARQKIINADEQELKELEEALQDTNGKLSEAAKLEKQEQLRSKAEAYQRRVQDFNQEIQLKQRDLVGDFSKKIADAAQAVAKKEGYTAILDKGNEELLRIVIYYQPSLDVTELVLKEFDRQNK